MSWVLATIAAWILLAVVACLLIARAIRLADREALRAAPGPAAPNVVAHQIPQSTDGTTAVAAEGEAGPAPDRASKQHVRPAVAHDCVPAIRRAGAGRHLGRS